MKKVSLSDVAKSLGVSKTLVSFVINGKSAEKGISKTTEKKVLDKVKELDYHPNNFARILRTGKSKTIGIVVADISNAFYATICRGVENQASKHGYNVVFSSSDENPEKEKMILKMMSERGFDGVILAPTRPFSVEVEKELKNLDLPLVLIDRHYPESDINYIAANNFEISSEATKYLIDKGHRNIGFIALKPTTTSVMFDRFNGYKTALEQNGIPFNEKFYTELDLEDLVDPTANNFSANILKDNSITAIVSSNNKVTLAILECFKNMNIKIPDDISLISFDFLDVFKILNPPISSIQLFADKIGLESAKLLFTKISDKVNSSENIIIEAHFQERQSVKEISISNPVFKN